MYLGAKLPKKSFEDDTVAWRLSPTKYMYNRLLGMLRHPPRPIWKGSINYQKGERT
jgi:hypothetical protein